MVSRRWLFLATVAMVSACSGDDSGLGTDSTSAPVVAGPGTTSASTTASAEAGVVTSGEPPTTSPPSAECVLATDVVRADVAVGLLEADLPIGQTSTAGGEPTVESQRDELAQSLATLAASQSRMAGPATAVLTAGLAPAPPDRRGPGPVEALNVAMLADCSVRLSTLGVLRPDRDPADALAGLGLAFVGGDECEVASVLRWADAEWRIAPNGGEQDRIGVVVRHALEVLRLDGGVLAADLPVDIGQADLSGWSLSPEHDLAIVRFDADLRRACERGLEPNGLLMEGLGLPTAAAYASLAAPAWAEPVAVDADAAHARWCAAVDDIYAHDVALDVATDLRLDGAERLAADLRLLIGALRPAARTGGSISTLDDVRDVVAASRVVERGDLSAPGRLSGEERRAVGELDRVMLANCGVGFAATAGVLGRFARPSSSPPLAPTSPTSTVATTTSTTLPSYLPNTAVAVVGDSLAYSAQTEIVDALRALGLGTVVVDGQVSRRMTSSTDTIRSGVTVVSEIAAAAAPRIWVIALGTNDVASGSTPAALSASVQRVLDAIPADSLVVWVDTYIRDEPEAVTAGNLIIRDVVGRRPGAVVADFFSYADDPGVVGSDGVHLTTSGRRLFANVIANGIAVVLGRNPQFDLSTAPPSPPTFVAVTTTTLPPATAPTPWTTTTSIPPATVTTPPSISVSTSPSTSTTTTHAATTTSTSEAAPAGEPLGRG